MSLRGRTTATSANPRAQDAVCAVRPVVSLGTPRSAAPRRKYHAVPTVVDGVRFDSQKEGARFAELRLLEKAGLIRGLELQPRYSLSVRGVKIGEYRGDFRYDERVDGQWFAVCEDVKGFKTPMYRWKRKHMLAEHGIEVREI